MKNRLLVFICSILVFGVLSEAFRSVANANDNLSIQESMESDLKNMGVDDAPLLSSLLLAIESIPDSVVEQGGDVIAQWLEEEMGTQVIVKNDKLFFPEVTKQTRVVEDPVSFSRSFESFSMVQARSVDWGVCARVVGLAIVSNGIPFAKILKLKKTLKQMGGAFKTVKKIYAEYKDLRTNPPRHTKKSAIDNAIKNVAGKNNLQGEVKDAFLDFFGIAAIQQSCF